METSAFQRNVCRTKQIEDLLQLTQLLIRDLPDVDGCCMRVRQLGNMDWIKNTFVAIEIFKRCHFKYECSFSTYAK